jgi:putative hemolysin
VNVLSEYAPWLAAMSVLILASAFFSASEAALFYLDHRQRRRLAAGSRTERIAAALLADPERLLTAVLFWNLVVNLVYFTIVSIIALRIEEESHPAKAGGFALVSLLVIIVFSEMLPKSLAVLAAGRLSAVVAIPLAAAVRLVAPVLPWFRVANVLSQRLFWPHFEPEPYLRVGDLERAVELSTRDRTLLEQEQAVLQNIVSLSEIRVDEMMRPRTRFRSFRPPVSLADLGGRVPPSGYLLVTEPDSDEVAGSIALKSLSSVPTGGLEHHAQPVVYVPWCTTVAEALETMQKTRRRVSAVVNEFGEMIGVLTIDDVLETIFSRTSSRSERLLKRIPIRPAAPGVWHVTGMTSLRRLVRHFRVERPSSKSLTVAGVVQEALEKLPEAGDECRWGPFRFKVLDIDAKGQLTVELTLPQPAEEDAR